MEIQLAYTPLEGWDAVEVTGNDRVDFVHNLVSNRVKGLPLGASNSTLALTAKGRILQEAILTILPERLLLLTPPKGGEAICSFLEHYHVIEDVTFAQQDRWQPTLLLGAELESWFGRHQEGVLPEEGAGCQWSGVEDTWASRIDRLSGLPALLLWSPAEQREALHHQLQEAEVPALEQQKWEALRGARGWYDSQAVLADLLVHEAGLHESHVSYDKGCFVGQEVVARTQHRGRANYGLFTLALPEDLAAKAQAPVFDGEGKEIGALKAPVPGSAVNAWVALLKKKPFEDIEAPGKAQIQHEEEMRAVEVWL